MSGRVAGKVAIVTGASRGVGLEDAKLFVREGAQVIMTDVNEEDGQKAADAIGSGARFVKQDVSSEDGWKTLIELVEKEYGRLDILVNNAGILRVANIEDETLAGLRRMISINMESVFLGTQAALPLMEASGGGSFVNMSSVASLFAMPHFTAYGVSKAGVRAITQSTAVFCHKKGNKRQASMVGQWTNVRGFVPATITSDKCV